MAAETKIPLHEPAHGAVVGSQALNTAKLAGEALLPGASELIAGNIGSGIGHFLVNGLVVAALAPTMPLLAALATVAVRTNAYSGATRGLFLWQKG